VVSARAPFGGWADVPTRPLSGKQGFVTAEQSIGMEILRQAEQPIDAIFVAIGGGGLISGIAAYVKRLRPEIRIIGVQPVDSDAMSRSIKAGRRIELEHVGLFADGVAVKLVGEETFRLSRALVDEIVLVDTDAREN
jgi:threonine dehydratase